MKHRLWKYERLSRLPGNSSRCTPPPPYLAALVSSSLPRVRLAPLYSLEVSVAGRFLRLIPAARKSPTSFLTPPWVCIYTYICVYICTHSWNEGSIESFLKTFNLDATVATFFKIFLNSVRSSWRIQDILRCGIRDNRKINRSFYFEKEDRVGNHGTEGSYRTQGTIEARAVEG